MKSFSRRNKPILFEPRERDRNFILSVVMTTTKMLVIMMLLIGVGGSGVAAGIAKAWIDTTPDLDLDELRTQSQTSFIYDRYGNLITEYKGSENRIYATLDEMPQNLIHAFISIEDARFYKHNGVDIKRIGGSLLGNLVSGDLQGASTITTQLIKLTLLSSEQTYKRKIQEAYLALQLEKVMTKDEILEEYLNVIYLGGACYGVKIAAKDYFGKDLSQLSLRECACLARLARNPYGYNPRRNYYKTNTPENIEDRVDYVLKEMYSQGYITQDELNQALSERLNVLETSSAASDAMYKDAYYVEYAIYDVVSKMLRVENLEDTSSNRSKPWSRSCATADTRYTPPSIPKFRRPYSRIVTNWDGYPDPCVIPTTQRPNPRLGGGEYLEVVSSRRRPRWWMDWSTGRTACGRRRALVSRCRESNSTAPTSRPCPSARPSSRFPCTGRRSTWAIPRARRY